jgi:hypothetical protein
VNGDRITHLEVRAMTNSGEVLSYDTGAPGGFDAGVTVAMSGCFRELLDDMREQGLA